MKAGAGPGAAAPLFLLSGALLLLELYWLRALAEAEWGHLASMVVSSAMLGIGAGGTLVVVAARCQVRDHLVWKSGLVVTAVASGIVPFAVWSLHFEPLLLTWRASTFTMLVVRELLVALPFAAGGAAIAVALRASERSAATYAVNLLGSGAGVALALVLMNAAPTVWLHRAATLAASFAAALGLAGSCGSRIAALAVAAAWTGATAAGGVPVLAPTKDLALALRLPEARLLEDRPGIPGRWTLVASPALHDSTGVSLAASAAPPRERALFVRGDRAGVIVDAADVEILRHRVSWLPYAIRSPRSVLVLGADAVVELQAARLAGAEQVVAAAPDRRTREALAGDLGRFAGLSRLDLRSGGDRAVVARRAPAERYDLVVIPPRDGLASASAGLGAGLEDYRLTVEGAEAALRATTDSGQVAVTRWTDAPPRDLPKLVATFARALHRHGPEDLRAHFALVRQWDAWTLCVSRSPYGDVERSRLRRFSDEHLFDRLLPEAGPVHHQLPGAPVIPLISAILSSGGRVPTRYLFHIAPATDDRPYFHRFLAYRELGAYLDAVRDGAIPPGEWGEIFVWASFASALVLGFLVVALPVLASRATRRVLRGAAADTLLFASLGSGFLFLEILFLQQGTRLVGEASLSGAIAIGAFLLGGGTGAALLERAGARPAHAIGAAGVAAVVALGCGSGLSAFLDAAASTGGAVRVLALAAPAFLVAVPLGMPFPVGLALASRRSPDRVPWLVAVNGWASVAGATLASLIAMILGFRALAMAAAVLYALAAFLLGRAASRANAGITP